MFFFIYNDLLMKIVINDISIEKLNCTNYLYKYYTDTPF